jgi:hypothetical protein
VRVSSVDSARVAATPHPAGAMSLSENGILDGLLATHVTPARFHSMVAPIAARLMQEEKTTSCTGA